MDIRGDLLLIIGSVFVLLCGPRWSRKSMDTRGDLLFILVLISSGLEPGKSQIPGVIYRKVRQVFGRGSAGGRRHGLDPWSFAYFN